MIYVLPESGRQSVATTLTALTTSAALVVPSNTDELLDAYSTWLFFERHFLHIGRFGLETAVSLIDTVLTNNTGAKFHLPPNADLPDYTAPARRAGLILSTVGLEVDCVSRVLEGAIAHYRRW